MKNIQNLKKALGLILITIFLQFTLVSCSGNSSKIIKDDHPTSKIDKEDIQSPDDRG